MNSAQQVAAILIANAELLEEKIDLAIDGCNIRIHSNSQQHLQQLKHYFAHVLAADLLSRGEQPTFEVIAIQREQVDLGLEFIDWKREPGKTGRKDAIYQLADARIVHKVRTGMTFLQSEQHRIAAGDCVANDNQVINFINTQYMSWLQQQDWLTCHAAAVTQAGSGIAMAGFSGGGKSTLMLHMLENDALQYVSNDRLFLKLSANDAPEQTSAKTVETTLARGIPKLPRINPGTIVNSDRLKPLISESERLKLQSLALNELWELEDKYDVFIDDVYGKNRINHQTTLSAFFILNWRRDSDDPVSIHEVELAERRDLLAAVMKSPGPFYQFKNGDFYQPCTAFDESAYLRALAPVSVYEISGGVDFETVTNFAWALLEQANN